MGAQAVQGVAVGVEFVGPLLRDLGQRPALVAGALDGLVVHIGEVADVLHLARVLQFEEPADDVVDDER